MASSLKVDYNDKQLKTIKADEKAAIKESNNTFDGMINQSDSYYQKLIDNTNQWGEKQAQLQQDRTDFEVQKIEQQKEQEYKDFQKEGSAAYVDWQKQTDDYGSNAEKMASMGLASSGYSESSQVAMYNQYQNRVALARETYNKAVLNYNNMITEARLQNSSALAEIAQTTLQTALEIGLQGFQYKNTLLLEKTNAKRQIEDRYYTRYQDRISQINTENSMAEQRRQYNQDYQLNLKKLQEDQRQFDKTFNENRRQFNEELALQKKKSNLSSSGGGGGNPAPKKLPKKKDDEPKKVDKKNTVSPKEVINLGYGPISDAAVKNLVKSGAVEVVKKNGKSTLKKTTTAPAKLNNSRAKPTVTSIIKRMFG